MPVRGIPGYTAPNVTAPPPIVTSNLDGGSVYVRPPPPRPYNAPPPVYRPGVRAAPPNYGSPRVQAADYGPPPVRDTRSYSGSSLVNPNLPLDPRARVYPVINSGIYNSAAQNLFRNNVALQYGVSDNGGLAQFRGNLGAIPAWDDQSGTLTFGANPDPYNLRHELGHAASALMRTTKQTPFDLFNPFQEQRPSFAEVAGRYPQPSPSEPSGWLSQPFPGMFGNPLAYGYWGGPEEYYAELASRPYLIPPELRPYFPQFSQGAYSP